MRHGQERWWFMSGRVSFCLVYVLDFLVNMAGRFSKKWTVLLQQAGLLEIKLKHRIAMELPAAHTLYRAAYHTSIMFFH